MVALDAQALRLQPLDQSHERFVVGPVDRNDLGIRASVGRVPYCLCSRRVPKIENQVQPIARRDGDAGRAEKIRQIENVRQVRDDEAVEVCRERQPVEAWHGEPRGCHEEQGAQEDSRPPSSGGVLNGIEKAFQLRKRRGLAGCDGSSTQLGALGRWARAGRWCDAIAAGASAASRPPGSPRAPPETPRSPARTTAHRRPPASGRARARFRRPSVRGRGRASPARAPLCRTPSASPSSPRRW